MNHLSTLLLLALLSYSSLGIQVVNCQNEQHLQPSFDSRTSHVLEATRVRRSTLSSVSNKNGGEPSPKTCEGSKCKVPLKPKKPIRCLKPEAPHTGFTYRPNYKRYRLDDVMVVSCHNGKRHFTLKCLDDGSWSGNFPPEDECPAPAGSSCPNVTSESFPDGHFNVSLPLLASDADLDDEQIPAAFPLKTKIDFECYPDLNLVGAKTIVCDPGYKWSFKVPLCVKSSEAPSPASMTSGPPLEIIMSIIIAGILVVVISLYLLNRWRLRVSERKRWQRYFGNYTYRSSKTHFNSSQLNSVRRSTRITTAQEMKLMKQTISPPVPITTDL